MRVLKVKTGLRPQEQFFSSYCVAQVDKLVRSRQVFVSNVDCVQVIHRLSESYIIDQINLTAQNVWMQVPFSAGKEFWELVMPRLIILRWLYLKTHAAELRNTNRKVFLTTLLHFSQLLADFLVNSGTDQNTLLCLENFGEPGPHRGQFVNWLRLRLEC